MSSIQGLLSEVHSNLQITQIIKAADQLYYKDKTLYTDIKPELISGEPTKMGPQASGKTSDEKQKPEQQQQERDSNKKTRESTSAAAGGGNGNHIEIGEQPPQQKQSKKDKKKAKQNQQKEKQPPPQTTQSPNQQNDSPSGNKLHEIIQQAQKTVQNALSVGTGSGGNGEMETELRKKFLEQEKRLKKLERITQQLLQSAGLTEADFSD